MEIRLYPAGTGPGTDGQDYRQRNQPSTRLVQPRYGCRQRQQRSADPPPSL